jgi:hypothetical protein
MLTSTEHILIKAEMGLTVTDEENPTSPNGSLTATSQSVCFAAKSPGQYCHGRVAEGWQQTTQETEPINYNPLPRGNSWQI